MISVGGQFLFHGVIRQVVDGGVSRGRFSVYVNF